MESLLAQREDDMLHETNLYRVESERPMMGRLWPAPGARSVEVHQYGLAISLAAKAETEPGCNEIRVVHVPTGEVVFSKRA